MDISLAIGEYFIAQVSAKMSLGQHLKIKMLFSDYSPKIQTGMLEYSEFHSESFLTRCLWIRGGETLCQYFRIQTVSIPLSNRRVPQIKKQQLLSCRGAPWNSIPGSNTQSTVAYLGPLYGKVVGVAIYSIHILYSTVNIIIFGQNWQPDKDMFVTVCICMNYFKRK